MRRIILDVGTAICLVATGIVLYRLSPSTVPLNFLARFENIIWVIALTTIAICRAYVERTTNLPAGEWLKITGWGIIVIVVHMILFWLDTVVTPQDNFPTVFAFGLVTFLLPGLVVSTIVYSAVSASLRNRT